MRDILIPLASLAHKWDIFWRDPMEEERSNFLIWKETVTETSVVWSPVVIDGKANVKSKMRREAKIKAPGNNNRLTYSSLYPSGSECGWTQSRCWLLVWRKERELEGKPDGRKGRKTQRKKGRRKFRRERGGPGGCTFKNVKSVQNWSRKAVVTAGKRGLTLTFTWALVSAGPQLTKCYL